MAILDAVTTFRDCEGISIYTTCPPPANSHGPRHAARVAEIARWSDEAGCDGILVYTDNANLDPWAVAQRVIDATTQLAPLVAVQPVYTHPYTVAKKVATLSYLYGQGRRSAALELL
jgi:alkanesulfonate monooxygenase